MCKRCISNGARVVQKRLDDDKNREMSLKSGVLLKVRFIVGLLASNLNFPLS